MKARLTYILALVALAAFALLAMPFGASAQVITSTMELPDTLTPQLLVDQASGFLSNPFIVFAIVLVVALSFVVLIARTIRRAVAR